MRQRRGLKINFREILVVVRLSTFATISVKSGGRGGPDPRPVSGQLQTSKSAQLDSAKGQKATSYGALPVGVPAFNSWETAVTS